MSSKTYIKSAVTPCVAILTATLNCTTLWADDSSHCEKLFNQQQFEKAVAACDKAARKRDAKAKAYLRLASHFATGVKEHSQITEEN